MNRALRSGGLEIRRLDAAGAGAAPAPAPAAMPAATAAPTATATAAPTTTSDDLTAELEPAPAPDRLSTELLRTDDENRASYAVNARAIVERHRGQDAAAVAALRKRYAEPLFGRVGVWELVERLGGCVDPSDERLYCASQLMHVRQILDEMERDGTATPSMVLVTLLHDLGKLLLLTEEDPENVVCMNEPVGTYPDGVGLDSCMVQWNHDELAYQRLKGLIPDDLAWLIRYHSLDIPSARHLMDAQDLERTERLLEPFAHYDHATKTPFRLPSTPVSRYRDIVEEALPNPIIF